VCGPDEGGPVKDGRRDRDHPDVRPQAKGIEKGQFDPVSVLDRLNPIFEPHQIADGDAIPCAAESSKAIRGPQVKRSGVVEILNEDDAVAVDQHHGCPDFWCGSSIF
jgi:hypothetical protein